MSAALAALLVSIAGVAHAAETAVMPSKPVKTTVTPRAVRLVEPRLRLTLTSEGAPSVALTFDACMGKVDHRILDTLVENRIPATIFVTARWLRHNAEAFAAMKAHPDLFEIEDHGAEHIPAIDRLATVYGIKAAGTPKAVADEVEGGTAAIVAAGGEKPQWFRGSTAKYTPSSIRQIEAMGYRIAGYSVNGDGGSLLGRVGAEKRFNSARDGDVIIAHVNQPTHEAGEGVVAGILGLKKRGYRFVLLRDQDEELDRTALK